MSPTENRQITDLKEIVEEQGAHIEGLIHSVADIKVKSDRIYTSLIGDEFTDNIGLVKNVKYLTDQQKIIEKRQDDFDNSRSIITAREKVFIKIGAFLVGLAVAAYHILGIVETYHNLNK